MYHLCFPGVISPLNPHLSDRSCDIAIQQKAPDEPSPGTFSFYPYNLFRHLIIETFSTWVSWPPIFSRAK